MTPHGSAAASKMAASRCVVVVLPFVPVTPTIVSRSDGWSNTEAAIGPAADLTSSTTTCGSVTSSTWSTTSADAPASTASSAKR